MSKSKDYIQENKPALFDWFVFSISFSLGFIFPTFRDLASSPLFSFLVLTALVLYASGAWLKHLPLYERLRLTGRKLPFILFVCFICIHYVLILAAVIFSMPAARIILSLPPAATKTITGTAVVITGFLVPTFITWLVFRNEKSKYKKYSSDYLFWRELAGDICLVFGVSIFSFIIWDKAILAGLFNVPVTSLKDVWSLFILLALSYILFYLPLRYLFLVEDHFSRTWKRMLLIFGLLLLKALFEILNL